MLPGSDLLSAGSANALPAFHFVRKEYSPGVNRWFCRVGAGFCVTPSRVSLKYGITLLVVQGLPSMRVWSPYCAVIQQTNKKE